MLARTLRQLGYAVELDPSGATFAKQFKRADRSGAPWAAVLGDSEVEQGIVCFKPLRATGEDVVCPLSKIHELKLDLSMRASSCP